MKLSSRFETFFVLLFWEVFERWEPGVIVPEDPRRLMNARVAFFVSRASHLAVSLMFLWMIFREVYESIPKIKIFV